MALPEVGARLRLEGRRELAAEAQGAERALHGVGDAAEQAGRGASGLERESRGLEKALGAVKTAGLAAAAAVAGGFASAIGQERSTDRLAASLGLDPAAQEQAGAIAGDLYAGAWGDSFDDVSGAVGAVMSTLRDLDGEGVERVTASALDLASAFGIDVDRAVSSAGVAISSGLARDADHAVDLMAAAMQRMPQHMREELLEATDEYGKFFDQLGLSGEESFGLLAVASQDGMYGIDKFGDALKELTIRGTDMSTASVDAYEAAGLSADDMAARFLAGGDTARGALDDLVAGLLAMDDPVARANAAIGLFGTPLEDIGVNDIPAFLASLTDVEAGLGDVGGAAVALGDTLNDNAATRIEQFKRTALQGLTDAAGGALVALDDLAAANERDLGRISEAAAGIGDALPGMRPDGEATSYLSDLVDDTIEGTAAELEAIERFAPTVVTFAQGMVFGVVGALASLGQGVVSVVGTMASGAIEMLTPIAAVFDRLFGTDLEGALDRGAQSVIDWRDDANARLAEIETDMQVRLDTLEAEGELSALQASADRLRSSLDMAVTVTGNDIVVRPDSGAGGGIPVGSGTGASSGGADPDAEPEGVAAREGVPAALLGLGRTVPVGALSNTTPARMAAQTPTPATVSGGARGGDVHVTVNAYPTPSMDVGAFANLTAREAASLVEQQLALAGARRGVPSRT